jgi:hypothetical protein
MPIFSDVQNQSRLLRPLSSAIYDLLNIVLELPPAPAALVLLGRWLAVFSARSAAAFLRITVAGPPGGFGDATRAVDEPEGVLTGDVGRGADYHI